MIVDFRRTTPPPPPPPLTIMNSTATAEESFTFLGPTISQDLKWDSHIESMVKKAQLYFLHQLRKFNLPQELLKQFYSVIIESVLCTSITVWFSSATKSDLRRVVRRVVRTAEQIIGTTLPTLQELYLSRVRKRARKITLNLSNPAHSFFELLSSGRRYRALRQNDQTQKLFLPPSNPSHEHLTLNVEHTTLLYIIDSSHILIFHLKFAHSRPVHT